MYIDVSMHIGVYIHLPWRPSYIHFHVCDRDCLRRLRILVASIRAAHCAAIIRSVHHFERRMYQSKSHECRCVTTNAFVPCWPSQWLCCWHHPCIVYGQVRQVFPIDVSYQSRCLAVMWPWFENGEELDHIIKSGLPNDKQSTRLAALLMWEQAQSISSFRHEYWVAQYGSKDRHR